MQKELNVRDFKLVHHKFSCLLVENINASYKQHNSGSYNNHVQYKKEQKHLKQ